MTFQSATQPLCRYCGKPIRKVTRTVVFDQPQAFERGVEGMRPERPTSREEAQRYVNGRITSVSWSPYNGRHISTVNTWDGESYGDAHFCTLQCAASMGRAVVTERNLGTLEYLVALEKQRGQE